VRPPTVLFQLTAIGRNPTSLAVSVRSVLHWLRNTPRLAFRWRLWVVVEPEGVAQSSETFEALRDEGAEIVVVPPRYRTFQDTWGKGRALQYASERRTHLGLSTSSVWVYHQDEETSVGQDTLLGISDFLVQRRGLLGTGIILYPLDWSGGPAHVQELTRSFDDLRVLDSMTMPGNPTSGFHGSHFLVRADIEDSVGWDVGGYAPAEDLLFEVRVRASYGSVFGVLPGFAYEKAAHSISDQLRQRRRWVHGILHALRRRSGLPAPRRWTLAYGALSWFSALPSLLILAAGLVVHYGPVLLVTGVFTGLIWTSMVLAYLEGYRLHGAYLTRKISRAQFLVHGFVGALVDLIAPWYALMTRPSRGDFIQKDLTAGRRSRAGLPTAAPRGNIKHRARTPGVLWTQARGGANRRSTGPSGSAPGAPPSPRWASRSS
jgi:egghead protein (zeste-white 4 protein)